jgi:hypothetical protein
MIDDDHCAICEEAFQRSDEGMIAEMYDPHEPSDDSFLVHAECGIAAGWEIA